MKLASLVLLAAASTASADTVKPVKPTPALASAMAKLAFMRGTWSGPATGSNPGGKSYAVTQTERIGPMLGGDIMVMEGRGYTPAGDTGFNAFAVLSWDPASSKYELRSYAMGHAGTFELQLTADGYVWTVPAGPDSTIRYTATVKDNKWREVGELVAKGKPPVKTFEMNLVRQGDTDWPLGTPVAPAH